MSIARHLGSARLLRRAGALFSLATIVLFGLWLTGLRFFVAHIPQQPPPLTMATDAVVVLTGGRGRLDAGLEILDTGYARKLFVSGVYRGVDVAALLRLSRRDPQNLQCCIALGYVASNTRENALETAGWIRQQGYRSLRLVTANYHMPRSLVEFQRVMPTIAISQFPIVSDNVDLAHWWRPATARLLLSEYNKYLIARSLSWLPPSPLTPQIATP